MARSCIHNVSSFIVLFLFHFHLLEKLRVAALLASLNGVNLSSRKFYMQPVSVTILSKTEHGEDLRPLPLEPELSSSLLLESPPELRPPCLPASWGSTLP